MVRFKPEVWFLFFVTGVLFYVAVNIQAGWLFILVFMVISLFLCSLFISLFWLAGTIRVGRAASAVFAGERMTVVLRLKNLSFCSKYFISLVDEFQAKPVPTPFVLFVPVLKKGEELELSYRETAEKRGVYSSGFITLISAGPSPFVSWKKKVPCQGDFVVYPRAKPFHFQVESASLSHDSSPSGVSFKKGGEEEFFGVRQYEPGDSLRNIHWPSSAKTGKLMIREMQQFHPSTLSFYLDLNKQWEGELFEELVGAAAYAMGKSLENRHVVKLYEAGRMTRHDLWGGLRALAAVKADQPQLLHDQLTLEFPLLSVQKQLFIFSIVPENVDFFPRDALSRLQEESVELRLFLLYRKKDKESAVKLEHWLNRQQLPVQVIESEMV